MSFLSGPECSTAANPLAQFQKQTSTDTSLQRDRLTSRPPGQLNGFRSQQSGPADAQFQNFSNQGPQLEQHLPQQDAFHMEQLRREAERLDVGRSGSGSPMQGQGWAGEFGQGFAPQDFAGQKMSAGPGFSGAEFAQFRQSQMSPVQAQQQSGFQTPSQGYGGGMYGGMGGMQRPMYQSQFGGMGMMGMQQGGMMGRGMEQQEVQGKGKGRVQELSDTDWERQFEELSKDGELEELDEQAQRDVERELEGIDRDMLDEGHMGDAYDQWKDFDGLNNDFDGMRHNFDDYATRGPQLGQYLFEEPDIFKDVPNAFAEGQKIMREGGNLSLAALAFESAVQKQPDHIEAWVALGQAQAQNEKESPAIRALEHALKLDENNLEALMGLSVSYTNEGYDSLAYRTLERWVSVKYPQLQNIPRGMDDAEEMGFTDRHRLHEKVTDLFLNAAQLNPEGAEVDCDVQVGLGVLFYGSEDYDKAVDCFTAALNSAAHGTLKREGEEHLLWNRLGATLANSNRSEEAIEAYSRALELRSNFVRARYNLGVSCINLGVHEEAAGHLLGALSMHRVLEREGRDKAAEILRDGEGNDVPDEVVEGLLQQNQSTNLYETLRRVFTQMGRRELAERVGPDMDLDGLRGEFEF